MSIVFLSFFRLFLVLSSLHPSAIRTHEKYRKRMRDKFRVSGETRQKGVALDLQICCRWSSVASGGYSRRGKSVAGWLAGWHGKLLLLCVNVMMVRPDRQWRRWLSLFGVGWWLVVRVRKTININNSHEITIPDSTPYKSWIGRDSSSVYCINYTRSRTYTASYSPGESRFNKKFKTEMVKRWSEGNVYYYLFYVCLSDFN